MKKNILLSATFAILGIAAFNTMSYNVNKTANIGLKNIFGITNANAETADGYSSMTTTKENENDGVISCDSVSVTCSGSGKMDCTPGLTLDCNPV